MDIIPANLLIASIEPELITIKVPMKDNMFCRIAISFKFATKVAFMDF
nr:MAG TPA: hypothetical protein [Caudoviricetes sp.]